MSRGERVSRSGSFGVTDNRKLVILHPRARNLADKLHYLVYDSSDKSRKHKIVARALIDAPEYKDRNKEERRLVTEMCYGRKEPIKEGRITRSHNKNTNPSISCHEARNHKERERRVFADWVCNKMNSLSQKEMIEYYFKITGHNTKYQKYKSLEWNKPAHTIVAHLSKDGYMFIHPDSRQERSITVREAACLQSFPRDFEFVASVPYSYKMIGNAVPVQFAYGIATGICKILDKQ
jgi:site-specific DNA-cytosine methylase